MSKELKIEILKIVGMIIVLAALIFGIVFMNKKIKEDEEAANNVNSSLTESDLESLVVE